MPHAGHFFQFFNGRVQHVGQTAEPVDQRVRQRVGIAARPCEEQQKLHGIVLLKTGQPLLQKALVYAPAVIVVHSHKQPLLSLDSLLMIHFRSVCVFPIGE